MPPGQSVAVAPRPGPAPLRPVSAGGSAAETGHGGGMLDASAARPAPSAPPGLSFPSVARIYAPDVLCPLPGDRLRLPTGVSTPRCPCRPTLLLGHQVGSSRSEKRHLEQTLPTGV